MSVEQLRPDIRRLARTAAIHASNWMIRDEPTVEELLNELPEVVAVYTQSSALLAADWYNSFDPDSSYFALPDEDLPVQKIENVAKWVHDGPQRPESRIRVAAHRLVFDAARRTVQVNALAEGVGMARHEMAGSCDDCASRATRTARGRDSGTEDVDLEFHPSCEGLLVPVRAEIWNPPDYAAERNARANTA